MYCIYIEYRGCNELMTKVISLSEAKALCSKFNSDYGENFIFWYKKEVYQYDDWIVNMVHQKDNWTMFELLCFEEYYQNTLTFEENTKIFIKKIQDDNRNSGIR